MYLCLCFFSSFLALLLTEKPGDSQTPKRLGLYKIHPLPGPAAFSGGGSHQNPSSESETEKSSADQTTSRTSSLLQGWEEREMDAP